MAHIKRFGDYVVDLSEIPPRRIQTPDVINRSPLPNEGRLRVDQFQLFCDFLLKSLRWVWHFVFCALLKLTTFALNIIINEFSLVLNSLSDAHRLIVRS